MHTKFLAGKINFFEFEVKDRASSITCGGGGGGGGRQGGGRGGGGRRGALRWPAEHFGGVGAVVAVVRYHGEVLCPQGAAEVPLPDGRVTVCPAVPAHLRPRLAHRGGGGKVQSRVTIFPHERVLLHMHIVPTMVSISNSETEYIYSSHHIFEAVLSLMLENS